MYKLKKFSHLTQFKEKNYFKPMCCIIISNQLQENKDFYNILKTTLISLQNEKNYISIYLINSDKFEDDKNTFSDLYKDKPYFLMFFRSIQYEFFNNPINEFIPNIVSKICSINDGYLANISKAFAVKEKQEVVNKNNKQDNLSVKNDKQEKQEKQENLSVKNNKKKNTSVKNNKKENTSINKKNKKEIIIDDTEETNDEIIDDNIEEEDNNESTESSSSASQNEINEDIANKRKILKEKQKLLNDINE